MCDRAPTARPHESARGRVFRADPLAYAPTAGELSASRARQGRYRAGSRARRIGTARDPLSRAPALRALRVLLTGRGSVLSNRGVGVGPRGSRLGTAYVAGRG